MKSSHNALFIHAVGFLGNKKGMLGLHVDQVAV
jgi:hypothetical protein